MRGYQKRVIYVKNPGGNVFEEAYFIIKDGAFSEENRKSIIEEAEKIIKESSCGEKRQKRRLPRGALFFLAGTLCTAMVFALIILI